MTFRHISNIAYAVIVEVTPVNLTCSRIQIEVGGTGRRYLNCMTAQVTHISRNQWQYTGGEKGKKASQNCNQVRGYGRRAEGWIEKKAVPLGPDGNLEHLVRY